MRQPVKVTSSKDKVKNEFWINLTFTPVQPLEFINTPISLTVTFGTLYGCTFISDSYKQDEGERLLNLMDEVVVR